MMVETKARLKFNALCRYNWLDRRCTHEGAIQAEHALLLRAEHDDYLMACARAIALGLAERRMMITKIEEELTRAMRP